MNKSLSKAWDTPKYKVNRECFWVREDGTSIHPTKMNLYHLFHALMLAWNKGIPMDYRMPPYSDYVKITRKRRRFLISNLCNELMNRRQELPKDMWSKLYQIMEWIALTKKNQVPKALW